MLIDPKDFALTLGNPAATHVFIEKVNKGFKELNDKIEALEKIVEKSQIQQVATQVKKATKTV